MSSKKKNRSDRYIQVAVDPYVKLQDKMINFHRQLYEYFLFLPSPKQVLLEITKIHNPGDPVEDAMVIDPKRVITYGYVHYIPHYALEPDGKFIFLFNSDKAYKKKMIIRPDSVRFGGVVYDKTSNRILMLHLYTVPEVMSRRAFKKLLKEEEEQRYIERDEEADLMLEETMYRVGGELEIIRSTDEYCIRQAERDKERIEKEIEMEEKMKLKRGEIES